MVPEDHDKIDGGQEQQDSSNGQEDGTVRLVRVMARRLLRSTA